MSVTTQSQKRERVSVVCVFEGKILCFLGVDPKSGQKYYFLPGGVIEPGESEVQCGARETMEETGYRVRLDSSSKLTRKYIFPWNGQQVDCTTHFYRGYLDENFHPPKPVDDADYNLGPTWISISKIPETFGYHDAILNAVQFFT